MDPSPMILMKSMNLFWLITADVKNFKEPVKEPIMNLLVLS